jgi:LacI family transcriptional regulator
MALTIKSIAKKAGVSYATVSLALNNDQRVAEKTREKVRKIAEELKYIPNNFGRGLQSSKSGTVGCFIQSVTGSFFSEILQGIGECATENNYGLLTAICSGSSERLFEQLKIFREKRVDGIIVGGGFQGNKKILQELEEEGIKIVMASSELGIEKVPNVVTDNKLGGQMATEHLIDLGHRNIIYANPAVFGSGLNRFKGYQKAMKKRGLKAEAPIVSLDKLAQIMRLKKRPSAIVAYSDSDAIRIKHILEGIGLRYPKDYSITGFDNISLAAMPEFNLTTIAQDKQGIGKIAMQVLLRRINGEDVGQVLLKPELVRRNSAIQFKTK